ncbi:glycosyl hydrolase 115 family protein [Sphingomonas sp. HITSZ_GF]|uniref:glycosyl hydrolase 115 family protein n=1 Tax=Sphingomonas sp. HITSZ_GF TaxID=3037247 RepID=UPI00240D320D|nr:glycosyl hydrolase 115 family protein [Sphingomonas sp. HITSZ_GF]MDG2533110.1 glycosyl hydrolase 115 family protein [Sphingomonas sp. HITSZ_GF]
MRGLVVAALAAATVSAPALACEGAVTVCGEAGKASFALIAGGRPAAVLVDPGADPAVRHAADGFAGDLERVSGAKAARIATLAGAKGPVVLIGTLGRSPAIDALVRAGKIKPQDIAGEWEAFRQVVVDNPAPGVARALVIVGSDRRGAVYGAYDLSEKIGVSPWHWFADVPVARRANVWLTAGSRRDQPRVRYRGFFINDEAPAFSTWAQKKFGGANARAYAHIFELELRLKGNYLWPAMWAPRAFNDDDPQNKILADEMGVVMGTSHHEPMTRAQDEWHRNTAGGVTGGKWDYTSNAANLRAFWRGGIERMMSKGDGKGYESLITVGMRGDGDEPMAEGTATRLLEGIVADQRKIIAEVTRRPAEQQPQVWALYKEVQDYYDHGMQVPDDVILLFADDNWGQVRRLPDAGAAPRKGGYGVYYHFDYVGGPRNYKWLNTNQIEKSWQQMDLAWQRGARALWIVNVGDLKPMEYPLSFFMQQAWNPEAMTPEALAAYPDAWASAQFGPVQGKAIGALLTRYSQLAARRKPELIDAGSFALGRGSDPARDGGEFGAMVAEWDALEAAMLKAKVEVPAEGQDAYFQLVEHPVAAMANLYRLYYAVAWNRRLAATNDSRANGLADRAEALFARDQELSDRYHAIAGGKWDGMMLQTHIGYTNWQQPEKQVMPEVKRVTGPRRSVVELPAPADGATVIEAGDFARAIGGKGLAWRVIPHLGRTEGAVLALPQGLAATSPADGVRLEYAVKAARSGELPVQLILVPTLGTGADGTLRIGVSIDDGPVQVLTDLLTPAPNAADTRPKRDWEKAVEDNARVLEVRFPGVAAGGHVLKVWRIDDNVVLQRIVVGTGAQPAKYLGGR